MTSNVNVSHKMTFINLTAVQTLYCIACIKLLLSVDQDRLLKGILKLWAL